MTYKRSKYFTTLSKRKIKYLFVKKNSQITVVFFHGFMSDMIGKKPKAVQKFCKRLKLNFLKLHESLLHNCCLSLRHVQLLNWLQ